MIRALLACGIFLAVSPAQNINQARILEQAGLTDAALAEYRAVLDRSPADLNAYAGLRRLAVQMERFELLDSVSDRLAGLYPERSEYLIGRVEALLGRERGRDALAAGRRLLERRPDQVIAVADLFERYGELEPATALLTEYREAVPGPLVRRRLLELYERRQRIPEATRELAALLAEDERTGAEFLPRLREYGAHSDWRRSLAEIRRLPAGRLRARAEAELLLGAGREIEAATTARAGLDRNELYGLAHEAEAYGAFRMALALFEELGLAVAQARVLRELGRVDDALRLLRGERGREAAFELAQLERLVRKDYAAAARAYAAILRDEPGHPDASWGLASSRLALGDTAAARQALAGVARPADSLFLFQARLAFYAGNADSLRAYTNRLMVRYPTSRHLNDALELLALTTMGAQAQALARAMYAYETGRTDTALARARDLAAGRDAVAEHALLFIGRVYADLGRTREAFELLDSFPDRFPDSPRRGRALYEQAGLAGAMQDNNLRLRLLERLLLEYPDSPWAFIGRTDRAELLRPRDPSGLR